MAISRKTRFEVFKRDSFTCQYCGRKAPDVILQADHIIPKAENGSDDFLNLTTSCDECNGGKGARRLSDRTVLEKKRRQLELLQERREQLQMLHEWELELSNLQDEEIDFLADIISRKTSSVPNEHGRALLRRWIKFYGLEEVAQATRESFERYFKETTESWEEAFDRIPRVVKWKRMEKSDPERARYLYTTGILRNRGFYIGYGTLKQIYEAWESWGLSATELSEIAKRARNWSDFRILANARMERESVCAETDN